MSATSTADPSPQTDLTYSVGVDIGGTFTDCAVVTLDGSVYTGKAPTTPGDLSIGFFDSVAAAASAIGLTTESLLAQAATLSHGTTTGINALITGQTAKVALITTAGHADAIRIMNDRGRVQGASMAELLDWSLSSQPEPILPRERVFEIHERVDSLGDVVVALRDSELSRVGEAVAGAEVEAVAVCLLWSFANSSHEIAIRTYFNDSYPELPVSCSHEVAPRLGVYPRAVTTIMNASLAPLMTRYVESIADRALRLGFAGEVAFVQNDGGLVPASETKRFPVITLKSGPVAGVVGTAAMSTVFNDPNVIVADMGGTTFDVGVISGSEPGHRDEDIVERHQIHTRVVDVESVGAGGGSIAWADDQTGALRVGPRSAGARPGPICYGGGGTEVTVTDADVVLGILNATRPLPGGVHLDYDAAYEGLRLLGERIGLDPIRCAAGVVEVVDSHMEDLVRRVTVQRGQDPRDFSLWVYGGAAGAHAGLFSRELNVKRVVFPLGDTASVWSALGCTLLRRRREFHSSVFLPSPWNLDAIADWLTRLQAQAEEYAKATSMEAGTFRFIRSTNLKYGLQIHEVETPLPDGDITPDWAASVIADFERAYERQFGAGTGYSGAGVTMTALRVVVEGLRDAQSQRELSVGDAHGDSITNGTRQVFWRELDDWIETPILAGHGLTPDERITGPAVIEYPHTTLVARPGQTLWAEPSGNVVLDVRGQ